MTDTGVALVLNAEERALVEALREVPESPLRRNMVALLEVLFAYSREPRCPEAQGDGVPCENAGSQCDHCARVTELLEHLRRRVAE